MNCNAVAWQHPLLIFDIDGTLLEAGNVGRRALNAAFLDLFGVEHAFDALDFAGATDYEHFAQLCDRYPGLLSGCDASRFFVQYAHTLALHLQRDPLQVLPGVLPLLARLSRTGWPLTLGTGNTQAGAFAKLGAAGLAGYFPGGGFSEPHRTRRDIIAAARPPCLPRHPAVVIGDTPRDIDAAHALNLPVISVATGRFTSEQLLNAGADAVLPDLTDSDCFLRQISAVVR